MNVTHTHPGDLYSQNDVTPLASAIAKKHKANIDVQSKVKASSTHIGVVSCGRM